MDYRVRVEGGEAAADGDIHLDCWIEKETAPDTWEPVANGHRTMVVDGAAVLAITEDAQMTDNQKRQALLALFGQEAKSWGIDESDEAYEQMYALLPSGWPVTVGL